jgi:hypothetical protein
MRNRSFALAALVTLVGCAERSECRTGQVIRAVVRADGDQQRPLPGARVQIQTAGGTVVEEKSCDTREDCTFAGGKGHYVVTATADGFVPYKHELRVTPRGDGTLPEWTLYFHMAPAVPNQVVGGGMGWEERSGTCLD